MLSQTIPWTLRNITHFEQIKPHVKEYNTRIIIISSVRYRPWGAATSLEHNKAYIEHFTNTVNKKWPANSRRSRVQFSPKFLFVFLSSFFFLFVWYFYWLLHFCFVYLYSKCFFRFINFFTISLSSDFLPFPWSASRCPASHVFLVIILIFMINRWSRWCCRVLEISRYMYVYSKVLFLNHY